MNTKISSSPNPSEGTGKDWMRHVVVKPSGELYRGSHVPPSNGVPTSDEAAVAIEPFAQTQRERIYEYVVEQSILGATNQEIEIALGMPAQTVTPRMLELRKEGRLKESGMKRLTRSKRRAIVWMDSRLKADGEDGA